MITAFIRKAIKTAAKAGITLEKAEAFGLKEMQNTEPILLRKEKGRDYSRSFSFSR